jgi:hypothetical protein
VSWNTVSTQIVSVKVPKLEPSPRMGMLRLHDECVKHVFIIFGVKRQRKILMQPLDDQQCTTVH